MYPIILYLWLPVARHTSTPCLPLLLDVLLFLFLFLFFFFLRSFLRFFFFFSCIFFCLFFLFCFNIVEGLAGVTLIALFVPSAGFPCIHRGYLNPSLLIFVYLSWSFTNFRSMEKSSSSCLLLDSWTSPWTIIMLSPERVSSFPFQPGPYPENW